MGTAYAANGGTFRLGQSNSASKTTTLTNSTGTALRLNAPSTKAPLSVGTNKTKVPNLNADLLDGKDSSAFLQKSSGAGWAVIRPEGTVGRSSGGVTVAKIATGQYCIRIPGVDAQKTTAALTPDWAFDNSGGTRISHMEIVSDSNDCATKSDFNVRTFNIELTLGTLVAADNAFSINVPR
jgi:hypothetical protein